MERDIVDGRTRHRTNPQGTSTPYKADSPLRGAPPARVFVTATACSDASCKMQRTGHRMNNIISAMLLAEMYGFTYLHDAGKGFVKGGGGGGRGKKGTHTTVQRGNGRPGVGQVRRAVAPLAPSAPSADQQQFRARTIHAPPTHPRTPR